MENFDLLIVNQGVSGLALACGLNDCFRIAIMDHRIYSDISRKKTWDISTSLINITSAKILQYLKVWNQKITYSSGLLDKLEILRKNDAKKINFYSGYLGHSELGYIIDNYLIYQSLVNRAQKLKNIIFIDSNVPDTIHYHEDTALITVHNNYTFEAKLVIGADGIDSWVRNNANISIIFRDAKYYGLTTIIQTEKSHENTLRCIIHNDGLLVLLPLRNTNLFSIFWLLPSHTAKKYLYLSKSIQSVNHDLIKICCDTLGQCITYNNIQYNISLLRMQYTHNFISHRLVLLGRSAYTICPFFFQNINSELIDAVILSNYLKQLKKNNKDIGHYTHLKYYERNRKYKIVKDSMKIPFFHTLIYNENNFVKYTQYFIFHLINTIPNFKTCILHHIMGLDDMPKWLLKNSYD